MRAVISTLTTNDGLQQGRKLNGAINNMSIETVKNINGTGANAVLPSGYSSWKDFWEQKTGRKANTCNRVGCTSTANIVGAHVQIEGYGNSWYIVPLCQADNMRSGTFRAFGPFVPVNSTNPIIW